MSKVTSFLRAATVAIVGFLQPAKREANKILDTYKSSAKAAVDRVINTAIEKEYQSSEVIRLELVKAVGKGSAPAMVRGALELAVSGYDISRLEGSLQYRIRAEGERIKTRIDGARL